MFGERRSAWLWRFMRYKLPVTHLPADQLTRAGAPYDAPHPSRHVFVRKPSGLHERPSRLFNGSSADKLRPFATSSGSPARDTAGERGGDMAESSGRMAF